MGISNIHFTVLLKMLAVVIARYNVQIAWQKKRTSTLETPISGPIFANAKNMTNKTWSNNICSTGGENFSFRLFISLACLAILLAISAKSQPLQSSTISLQQRKRNEVINTLLQAEDFDLIKDFLNNNTTFINKIFWDTLIFRADLAHLTSNMKDSERIYDIAIEVAQMLNDKHLLVLTHYYKGRSYSAKFIIDKAIDEYLICKKLLERFNLPRDIIHINAALGQLHLYAENYKQATIYAEAALYLARELQNSTHPPVLLPDAFGVACALTILGEVYYQNGDYDQAISNFNQSLKTYQHLANGSMKYGYQMIDVLADLGLAHKKISKNIDAIRYFHQAFDLAQKLPYKDRKARVLNNIGVFYLEQEDYEKARHFINQSLLMLQQLNNPLETARYLLNLGVLEFRLHNHEAAIEVYTRCFQLAKEFSPQSAIAEISYKDVIITASSGMSAIHKEKGEYDKAIALLESGLALAKQVEDKTRIAENLRRQADVRYEMGEYTISATLAEESLRLAREMRFFNLSYYAATILGKAQLAQGQTDQAFQTLTQAIEWVEEARHRIVGQEDEKVYFFENKLEPYHILMKMMVDQNKPLEALRYAEQAKARSLLDAMQRGRIDIKKSMTEKERQEEQRLNQEIIRLNTQLRSEQSKQAPDAKKIEQLREELYTARLNYSIFEDTIPASQPESKPETLRQAPEPNAALNNLAGIAAASSTAFLQYAVTKDRLYLFVSTGNGGKMDLSVHSIPLKNEVLADQVNRFHRMVANRSANFAGLSRELYSWLIKPIEPQLRSKRVLCIVPDGMLWNIPFQALVSESGRYLIEDRAIYYAPSFSTLAEMSAGKTSTAVRTSGGLLAIGNPIIEKEQLAALREWQSGTTFESLPETEREVQALSRLFPPSRSKVLLGADAREDAFKSLTSTADMIHFATHGVLDNRQPLYSFLLFSRDSSDPENDGLLEAREIMNLKLNARMAVLSACETARGRIGAGEGVVGISWAFFIAGCPTTVVSQWKVDSAAATNLMIPFYRLLAGRGAAPGVSKSGALRQAMLGLMRDPRYRHPYYWAGFVVMGSDR